MQTASAGGYELGPCEAQAAGTPVIACVNTSVTEHVSDGKGYPVLPITSVIQEDASHCPKYLFSMQGMLDKLHEAYNDWKDNTDNRKSIIAKGLEYAHTRTWDVAAEQFDELFQKALASRIEISSLISTDKSKNKIIFVCSSTEFGRVLSAVPVIRAYAKINKNIEVLFGVHKKLLPVLEYIDFCKVFDINRLWIDNQELQNNRVMIHDLGKALETHLSHSFALGDYGNTWTEIYQKSIKTQASDHSCKYVVEESEKEWIETMFAETGINKENIKTIIIPDTTDSNLGIGAEEFAKVVGFFENFKEFKTVVIGHQDVLDIVGGNLQLHSLTLRQIFAAASLCDIIITNSKEYSYLAKMFDKHSILINSVDSLDHLIKGNDKAVIVKKNDQFVCSPCNKSIYQPCRINNQARAQCTNVTGAHDIFAKVLKIKGKYFKKKAPDKKTETDVNV